MRFFGAVAREDADGRIPSADAEDPGGSSGLDGGEGARDEEVGILGSADDFRAVVVVSPELRGEREIVAV